MKNVIIAVIFMALAFSCNTQKTATNTTETTASSATQKRSQQGGPPSYSKLLTEMDANKDGKLSESEVQGPLQNEFAKIDSNSDGFISETEFENAPKPQRGQRPSRN